MMLGGWLKNSPHVSQKWWEIKREDITESLQNGQAQLVLDNQNNGGKIAQLLQHDSISLSLTVQNTIIRDGKEIFVLYELK